MLLDRKVLLLKRKSGGFLKPEREYAIFDMETNEQLGLAKEEPEGLLKHLRVFFKRALLPNMVHIYDADELACRVKIAPLCSKAFVYDQNGNLLGSIRSKFFSGCFFHILDAGEREIGQLKGLLKIWHFLLLSPHGREIGTVTKDWDGEGAEELKKDPQSFVVSVEDPIAHSPQVISALLLTAGVMMDQITSGKK